MKRLSAWASVFKASILLYMETVKARRELIPGGLFLIGKLSRQGLRCDQRHSVSRSAAVPSYLSGLQVDNITLSRWCSRDLLRFQASFLVVYAGFWQRGDGVPTERPNDNSGIHNIYPEHRPFLFQELPGTRDTLFSYLILQPK